MTYFNCALDERRKRTITHAFKFLKKRSSQFDAIAFSGMSGAVMAPTLAYLLDKQLIIVRKDAELANSHSSSMVEYAGYPLKDRVIIVDDFVSSGATVLRIMEKIRDANLRATFVAVYCYAYGYDLPKRSSLKLPESWSEDE